MGIWADLGFHCTHMSKNHFIFLFAVKMAEMFQSQYSGGYVLNPVLEAYPQPVGTYGQIISAAYFTAYLPNHTSDQSTMMYSRHNQYHGYEPTQNTRISNPSDRHLRYNSHSDRIDQHQYHQLSTSTTPQQCDISNDYPMSKLRLPNIKTSRNVAENVMMEEADLGYNSLSDYTSIEEIATVEFSDFDNSSGSDDVFDDVKSNFSDIIDDVIGDVTNVKFEMEDSDLVGRKEGEHNALSQEFSVPILGQEPLATKPYFIQYPSIPGSTRDASTEQFLLRVEERKQKQELKCSICSKVFHNKTNLKVHLGMHSNARPHQCPYCDKAFTQKSTMRTHIRTHTGEKPYSCTFCARAFSDYSTYRKHQRVHTGEKPYACDICGKAFAQSGNMIRHKQTHYKSDNSQRSEF